MYQEGLAKSFRHNGLPIKGRLVVLVKGSEEEIIESTIERLKDSYFSSQDESILASLKDSVNLAIEPTTSIAPIQVLAAVLSGEYIYVCGFGEVSAYLSRKTKFVQIFSGKVDQVGSCSGSVREGDNFLLIDGAVSTESKELIVDLFDQPDSLTIAEDLKNNLENSLGVFIRVDSLTEQEIDEVIPQREEIITEEVSIPNTPEDRTINMREKKSLLVRFAELLPEKNPFEGRAKGGTSRRTAVSAGIVLIALLFISIIFGIGQKKNAGFKSSYQSELTQAQSNYDQAIAQKDINPMEARNLLSQAKTVVDGLLARNIQDMEVSSLKAKIDSQAPQILGIVDLAPSVLIDLSLLRQGIKAKELSSDQESMAILDEQGNRIVFAGFDGKNTGVTGGSDKVGALQTFVSANGKFYALTSDGVISLTRPGVQEVVIKKDDQWGQIAKIGIYGGNFYLVDTNGSIWRYTSGSPDKTNWLKSQVNLSTVRDLSVDGALWILTDGKIMKFVRGQGDLISPIGLDRNFNNPTALYTNEELDSIFVLDQENKRIVELDKNGLYKKAYVNDQLAYVKDFVVSKEAGKIILLTEAKVLELPLK
jgi:hypothetical protein